MTQDVSYEKMTNEEFDQILLEVIGEMDAMKILSASESPGGLREYCNNIVLGIWAERNPEKAYPEYFEIEWDIGFYANEIEHHPGNIFETKEKALLAIRDVYSREHADEPPADTVTHYKEGEVVAKWEVIFEIGLTPI